MGHLKKQTLDKSSCDIHKGHSKKQSLDKLSCELRKNKKVQTWGLFKVSGTGVSHV